MKNILEGINSRIYDVEYWLSDLENNVVEIIQLEDQKEEINLNEDSLRDSIKHINITS